MFFEGSNNHRQWGKLYTCLDVVLKRKIVNMGGLAAQTG